MITLITGAPGSGKSAALVDLLMKISAEGRRIYVDVQLDGPQAGKGSVPDLTLPHDLLDDARRWHEPGQVVDGSAIVLDEVQRLWRPTAAGSKVSPDVAALETHRHRGLDFFIVTQHPNLVHQNVRRLVGRHVHIRDVGLLGRWWYEWPEATNPELFRNAPVKKRYKLPKRVFGAYKSASLHIKPIRSVPRTVLLLGAAVVTLGGLSWYGYRSVSGKIAAAQAPVRTNGATLGQGGGYAPRSIRKAADYASEARPVIAGRPETAPMYQHLLTVARAPRIQGGYCMGGQCRCYLQGGIAALIPLEDCAAWVARPPFDPYWREAPQRDGYSQSTPGGVRGTTDEAASVGDGSMAVRGVGGASRVQGVGSAS